MQLRGLGVGITEDLILRFLPHLPPWLCPLVTPSTASPPLFAAWLATPSTPAEGEGFGYTLGDRAGEVPRWLSPKSSPNSG
jgi:hypothetical protein